MRSGPDRESQCCFMPRMRTPTTPFTRTGAFRPARTAAQIPEALLEEWGDTLVFGSLAKIKSMSGPRVGWSDPQAAQMNLSLYEQGVAQARIRGARRGDGGG